MRQITLILALASVLVAGSASAVSAQSETGSAAIAGTVMDSSQRAIAGATVELRESGTGYTRTLTTDARGHFLVQAVPVGTYTITATAAGFGLRRLDGRQVGVGRTEAVSLVLDVAAVTEEVTVSADRTPIDTTGTATSERIDQEAIANLPIRGRNFTEFVQLTPAVVQESDRFGLVISGQRSINSNVSIDGGDFNDPLQGNQRGGNESAFFFPQTAVREFQVVRTGASAEIGRTGAGFVNVVTKSGTNAIRGEAFSFNRTAGLTSADAFDRKLQNRQNQFGGSLGGPLKRDRAFYFAALEQNFVRVPFVVKFQDQATGVVVPEALRALEGEQHGTNNPTAVFGRTDVQLPRQSSLNLHYSYGRLRGDNFNFDSPQQDVAATANFHRLTDSHAVKAGFLTVLNSRWLNDARAQVATDSRSEGPNSQLPQIVIKGYGTVGGDTGRPRLFDSTRYQATDNISVATGRHQLRAGIDLNVTTARQERESNILGRYDFNSVADFVALKIARYRQTLPGFNPDDLIYRGTQHELGIFLQDTWSVATGVTVAAGLRWDGQWNPTPPRPNPAIPESAVIPDDLAMWQPRLGLTWDATGRGRTIVRLAGGVFAPRTPANLFQRVYTDNGISAVVVDSRTDASVLTLLHVPDPLVAKPTNFVVPPQRVFGFDPDFQNPRAYNGSATLEQRLAAQVLVSAGYIHSTTRHLQRRLDHNLFAPTIDATGMPIFPRVRPNPAFAQIDINESTAHSQYDALALSATWRPKRAQVQAHYTYAKNWDDDSNERNFSRQVTLNPFDLSSEWAPSKQDVRHSANVSAVLALPQGFTVGGILIARTGFPFTPVIGSDTQNDANDDNDRAIINGQVAPRNGMRQPSFFDLDLRLMKAIRFDGTREVQLVAELLNATRASNKNYANDSISVYGTPAQPVATAGQALFAPSTARFGGPRQLQLGLKVTF